MKDLLAVIGFIYLLDRVTDWVANKIVRWQTKRRTPNTGSVDSVTKP